jgi:FtsZ-binding cell division protein ZapB
MRRERFDTMVWLIFVTICMVITTIAMAVENIRLRNDNFKLQEKQKTQYTIDSLRRVNDSLKLELEIFVDDEQTIIDQSQESSRLYEEKINFLVNTLHKHGIREDYSKLGK